MNHQESLWILSIIGATLRLATPLIFAAMGGFLSERSGVVNVALEGFMLTGACTAAIVSFYTGSAPLGWLAAFGVGLIVAVFYGVFVIEFKANQIVAGMALNLLVTGSIPFITKILFQSTGSTPALALSARFSPESFLGSPLFWGFILVVVIHYWYQHTASGLWLQFAGDHPQALESAGVSVRRVRWWAVALSGGLAGWGGASLSIFLASSYSPLMTAGRGFMALAALIFGRWKPLPTLAACLFFGLTDALQIQLQGVDFWGVVVPVQWVQILPYLITLIAISGWVGESRAPKALGKN